MADFGLALRELVGKKDGGDDAGWDGQRRAAIIDIGSNSVRLVVYAGPARAPTPVFNEKLMVGLGSGLATTGAIEAKPYKRAMAGLARFKALTEAMGISDMRCVATAAVRDASNGAEFLHDARAIGLDILLLSGRDEARASGYGVLSAIPDADGIVADLGGGSLELVRVKDGKTAHHSSFPLGVLRIAALRTAHGPKFIKHIGKLLQAAGWPGEDRDLPLYMVGGSWRAMARYDLILSRDPMPVVSGHKMPVEAAVRLARRLKTANLELLSKVEGLASARVATLPDAAALLVPLVRQLQSSRLVISTSGLREGLLYRSLPPTIQQQDPLIATAEAEGQRFARFAPHGRAIDAWIASLFDQDDAPAARLRLACCLLSDVASTANPDFRAERAAEMALHGQWWGIDLDDRLVIAQTLFVAAGGQGRAFAVVVTPELEVRLARAGLWGLAIRLAQRLSGGAVSPFAQSRLDNDETHLRLTLSGAGAALRGEQVEKRLKPLAEAVGLKGEVVVSPS